MAITGNGYQYCSTQVNLPTSYKNKIIKFAKSIPKQELYNETGYGITDDPHITVLYGIKNEEDFDKLKFLIKSSMICQINATLGTLSKFENEKFDVLKVSVNSKELTKLHNMIKKNIDNADEYPRYNSHLTIAYMKKGEADKYVGDKTFAGTELKFNRIMFSNKKGGYTPITLPKPTISEFRQMCRELFGLESYL
jgi:2'-5' RNA ligase